MERLGTQASELYYKMVRKRPVIAQTSQEEMHLKRNLTTFDITLLGKNMDSRFLQWSGNLMLSEG